MASQKRKSKPSSTPLGRRLGQLTERAFWVVNLVCLAPVVLSLLAPWVSPAQAPWLGYLALGVPLLLLVPVVWLVFWCVYGIRRAVPNLVVLLVHLGSLSALVQLPGGGAESDTGFRVVSYNVNAFYYDTEAIARTFATLKRLAPDVLLLQEYYGNDNRRRRPLTDSLARHLGLPHRAVLPLAGRYFGLAVFSRYPIVAHGRVWPVAEGGSTTNGIQWADIALYGRRLRLYNLHLASYFTGERLAGSDPSVPETWGHVLGVALPKAWQEQEAQLAALGRHRSTCPYPVVVAGDLNNPPFGYAYRSAHQGLHDAFRHQGQWAMPTYTTTPIPYRIDYIFADPSLTVLSYASPPETASDHRPVVAELSFLAPDGTTEAPADGTDLPG
ncbi:MAG: endonuclease/exonuclease/phosphatase family protein [Bacteroidia bacterium]|nr:endonuclease/exonuclease/phosphatase family protein [Bacteroidia bacterium]